MQPTTGRARESPNARGVDLVRGVGRLPALARQGEGETVRTGGETRRGDADHGDDERAAAVAVLEDLDVDLDVDLERMADPAAEEVGEVVAREQDGARLGGMKLGGEVAVRRELAERPDEAGLQDRGVAWQERRARQAAIEGRTAVGRDDHDREACQRSRAPGAARAGRRRRPPRRRGWSGRPAAVRAAVRSDVRPWGPWATRWRRSASGRRGGRGPGGSTGWCPGPPGRRAMSVSAISSVKSSGSGTRRAAPASALPRRTC